MCHLKKKQDLFEAPDPIACFVGSVMRISTLATFIVRKNTCNFVSESGMVNSVSVKQEYHLIACLFVSTSFMVTLICACIRKILGIFDMAYLD